MTQFFLSLWIVSFAWELSCLRRFWQHHSKGIFFWRKMWRLHHFVWWWFIIECRIFWILSRLFDHMTDPKPLIFYAKIFVHEALFINELSCSRLGICIFPCGLALELNANSKMSPLPSWLQSTCFTSLCLSRLASREIFHETCVFEDKRVWFEFQSKQVYFTYCKKYILYV